MATKSTTRDAFRSSVTGRFVTEKFSETHKRTTEHERIKHPTPPTPSSPKKR